MNRYHVLGSVESIVGGVCSVSVSLLLPAVFYYKWVNITSSLLVVLCILQNLRLPFVAVFSFIPLDLYFHLYVNASTGLTFFLGGLDNGKGCMSRRWVSWKNHACWGYVHWALSVSWALPPSTSLSSPTSSSCKISTLNIHCCWTLCRERCSTMWNSECLLTFLEALAGY